MKKFISKFNNQQGQVLLVVILVMVVALTVGLALASRSITNLRNATDEEYSQKAFSAAEAGIEQFLRQTCTPSEGSQACELAKNFDNNATFTAVATPVQGASFVLNGGNPIAKDDGIDLWLSSYSEDSSLMYQSPFNGNVTIYWGDAATEDCNENGGKVRPAALEVILIYNTKANPYSKRYAVDPCGNRRSTNNFDPPASSGGTIGGVTFDYKTDVNSITNGLIMRIIPLYRSAKIGVEGKTPDNSSLALPSQGNIITSTGSAGGTQRKITLVKGFPSLSSEFFQYILFSTK